METNSTAECPDPELVCCNCNETIDGCDDCGCDFDDSDDILCYRKKHYCDECAEKIKSRKKKK